MKTYLYRASNLKSTIAFLAFVSERREELSNTCNPKVMSKYPSAPDATSLHHSLKNKQLKLIWLQW